MMMITTVSARRLANRDSVVDMTPVIGRSVLRIDADRLDRVDRFQGVLDLGPTGEPEQDLAAGSHAGHRRDRLISANRAENVDPGDDRPVLVRRPADEGEDASGRKGNDSPAAVDDALLRDSAESDPALDSSLR